MKKQPPDNPIHTHKPFKWWTDRTFITLALSLVLIIVMGSLRPEKDIGMYPNEYWARKITWESCADAVLTGDSRVLMGVAPTELEKALPYKKIRNYGFGANWYSKEYLDAVEDMLLADASPRAVFMGITPHSLTGRQEVMGHYMELKKKSPRDIYMDKKFGAIVNFFEPMSFRDALHGLFPGLAPTNTVRDYRKNGWVAVHKSPQEYNEVKRYKGIFLKRRVSQQVVDNITTYVERWTQKGIRVYGFIMPSCDQMVEVELEMSGFNPDSFISKFRNAGGRWIDVDLGKYATFDGSHLQKDAALAFSKDLAEKISKIEERQSRLTKSPSPGQ